MLLALGLFLTLPLAGALRQETNAPSTANFTLELAGSPSGRGISVTRILPDGELERVVRLPGLCARETIVNWGDTEVALREIWLEKVERKLQLIYESDVLTDCVDEEYPRTDENSCLSGVRSDDYDDDPRIQLFDLDDEDPSKLPQTFSWISSIAELRRRCDRLRSRVRNQIVAQHRHRGYLRSTNGTSGNRRQRRGRSRTRRELLLIPGTQWCGRGHRATKYTNLGGFGVADACCRKHDTACPFSIPAFETRYGLFNWGISTMMHCGCDERFRTCLKMADTASANFIGKIFFDVLRTKCFVLKPQKVCTKRTWWGKCLRHEYRKQAHVRDNVPYY